MQPTKARLLFVGMLLLMTSNAWADQFCNGFERGYVTGYKRASNSSLDPLTPLCPLQPLKRMSDPESDFEHGYVIGLQRGYEAVSSRR